LQAFCNDGADNRNTNPAGLGWAELAGEIFRPMKGATMVTTYVPGLAVTPGEQAAMATALSDFEQRYPVYTSTAVLDQMRARDYARLDATGHVYCDFTGGCLYGESQLARHRDLLAGVVLGNPHSQNVPSLEATDWVEATRAQVLDFFRASAEEYEVVFTPNATGALRLVGEAYPFGPGGRLLLTYDNHNSVNGIRQFARAKGASVTYVPLVPADLRVSEEAPVRAEATSGAGFYLTPGPAGFEDGTVDYLGIPAVGIGLDHISSVGVEIIHTRVMCLTGWLLEALGALRHGNGAPVVRIYGPAGTDRRGGTIAMNFLDPAGVLIDSVRVERQANMARISLRSGCHYNPGVREVALGFSTEVMAAAFKDKDRLRYDEFLQVIDGKTTGVVRASIGLVTTFADVYRFWEFAGRFRDIPADSAGA
jgi:selenocysteine lyase/cysteine desulfurase